MFPSAPFVCRSTQCCVAHFKHLFSTSSTRQALIKQSTVKVVDNSKLGQKAVISGKKVKILHVYKKTGIGTIGDKVLLSVAGEKKKAYIVGCRKNQNSTVPRFDSNNVVLVEENGTPTGTRIRVPIPSALRGKEGDFTKLLSIATRFV